MLTHPFDPVYNEQSELLILGTFPSVKSRENEFYYGHPQNRFWKVLAAVFADKEKTSDIQGNLTNASIPDTIEEKKAFLIKNKIALWDTIASCEITGSADSTITSVIPNDINSLLAKTKIKKICCNGTKAWELFIKNIKLENTQIEIVKLPSTSPANASWSLEKLSEEWKKHLKK